MSHNTTITHTIPLQRWPSGFAPEALGAPAFWSAPIDQMYAQLPFPDFWREYRLTVFPAGGTLNDARIIAYGAKQ